LQVKQQREGPKRSQLSPKTDVDCFPMGLSEEFSNSDLETLSNLLMEKRPKDMEDWEGVKLCYNIYAQLNHGKQRTVRELQEKDFSIKKYQESFCSCDDCKFDLNEGTKKQEEDERDNYQPCISNILVKQNFKQRYK
jgi:hypothetical protein